MLNAVTRFRAHLAGVAALLFAAALAASFALPVQAHALEVERWTAKANQDSDNTTVLGATPTRVTWQGQTDEGESVAQVVINLPEGTTVEAENVKPTVMSGLDRLEVSAEATVEGTSVTVNFPEGAPAGSLLMVELNRTLFPADGGTFGLKGSYTTADGQTHDMPPTDAQITISASSPTEALANWIDGQDWVEAWNSVRFLELFFNPATIVRCIPALFSGWLLSLAVVAISFPLAIPLGLLWSFMRMAKHRVPRAIGATYINIVRGTPLFLQLYIAFFGLPQMGINITPFAVGAIVLILNSSAYLAEIFRAGIQSISKGQFEASRSLGMNGVQTMFFVIIPQTVRRVIPTMTSEFILMYKDTALLSAVGVTELMMRAKVITATTGDITPYIVAAGFYLIVTIPMTKFINSMESRMGRGRKRKKGAAAPALASPAAAEPTSEAVIARNIRMSETFAAPAVDGDLLAQGNHMSH
ncbi:MULTISPECIES: amino acid ABC transporter permease [Gordonibacter]|uniref:Amino acid ABC transporter permease n=1 Tax=Gordonibacter faecis TaxID=3047475 RepID=A0ABT7DPA2_9ACTN|nr:MULTISPECIES: amino acid ABC transporter permease [unclassified Gordonibacter]MDJ1651370.1 amino acid ABC transporter permease [Gordonibacter sp. KGMB12511]HIW75345.1 amino acid ABC transporter permease [Candidatus Gordonibacter avicola]